MPAAATSSQVSRSSRTIADQIAARLVWFDEEPMLPGRSYTMRCGGQVTTATISTLKYKLNVDNLDHVAGKTLELNEVGECNLSMGKPIVFDPYVDNTDTGSFILIDRFTNATVAAGMIEFGLHRATNVQWQELFIDKTARAGLKGQKPCVLWFTGLSGSGKSTIANTLEKRLHALGRHTYMLDGDNVRHGLSKDLGFSDADRVENIRRVAEAARLFIDAGLIVMVSFISPFRSERRMARKLVGDGEFIEIFVDTPLEVCEARDPKGLYRKARAGLIRNFTGIDFRLRAAGTGGAFTGDARYEPRRPGRTRAGRTQAPSRRLSVGIHSSMPGDTHFPSAICSASAVFRLLAQISALRILPSVSLKPDFLLADEFEGNLDRGAFAQQRRGGERQHHAELVLFDGVAIAAQRLVDGLLAVLVSHDQAVGGIDEKVLTKLHFVEIAVQHEPGVVID